MTGGKLIACRVENRGDSGNLYVVLALSLGEIGYNGRKVYGQISI